ncbi:IclR family transcriptional regulator C-terminal domain-containing protein [Haloarculaceae archaeon H-GB2-1]|nr:IclR family transcriptional regulator C-terminal domain-containing protein [Haloarculaceae archaeon H-GB2-1]
MLNEYELCEVTEKTITDRSAFKQEIAHVQEQGYAVTDEECVTGYKMISGAVTYPDDSIVGAISVGGPVYIFEKAIENRFLDDLHTYVSKLEDRIENMVRPQ